MATAKVIKSDCILCINSCGINAYVEDGKLVKVDGMKEHPISVGLFKGQASTPHEEGERQLGTHLLG
jgi:anaerobic selenocysteine-containing dehydrogenase